MNNLAVVVPPMEVDRVLQTLRETGVYDDSRGLRQTDTGLVEIPVTEAPAGVGEVTEQPDPVPRLNGLEDHLEQAGWTPEELKHVPRSWAVIGDIVLVRFPAACPRQPEVAAALLELHGADTVLARNGIEGPDRVPNVEVIAGSGDTETIHTEHGTKYAMDLAEVMFSPGNKAERVRMADATDSTERVLDMFAGIGYFTLPMARAGAQVTAIERNPTAFKYLVENVPLNEVTTAVRPFRGDCRDITTTLVDAGDRFDRVVMGYYDAADYLDAALPGIEPGGILHMHEATPNAELWNRPVTRLESAATEQGRDVELLDRRRVKTHSEGVTHVVIDARID